MRDPLLERPVERDAEDDRRVDLAEAAEQRARDDGREELRREQARAAEAEERSRGRAERARDLVSTRLHVRLLRGRARVRPSLPSSSAASTSSNARAPRAVIATERLAAFSSSPRAIAPASAS